MRLYDLSFATWIYAVIGKEFDEANEDLPLGSRGLDLNDDSHGKALMRWLNRWGCRQFAKENHDLSIRVLRGWASVWLPTLPTMGVQLMSLRGPELRDAANAYEDLSSRLAGGRRRQHSTIEVRFGPTGAAKIMYAMRPDCFPPWDDAIRKHFAYESYGAFLQRVQREIEELKDDIARYGFTLDRIPAEVQRQKSSIPKLVDEFYWVTITRKVPMPTKQQLSTWLDRLGQPALANSI